MTPEQERIERLKPGSTFALLGDGMEPCVMLTHHITIFVDPRETETMTDGELANHLKERFLTEMGKRVEF